MNIDLNNWLKRLRPKTALSLWSAIAFLIAVAHLVVVQRGRPGALVLFLLPTLFALGCASSDRRSTRILAASFLTLIDFGLAISHIPQLFPDLTDLDQRLSLAENRALGWYMVMYLMYLCVIVPPFLFGRGLLDRRYGRRAFSLFTNVLGLVTWALLAPFTCWLCVTNLGLWPPLRW